MAKLIAGAAVIQFFILGSLVWLLAKPTSGTPPHLVNAGLASPQPPTPPWTPPSPPSPPPLSSSSSAAKTTSPRRPLTPLAELESAFRAHIEQLQNPSDCSTAPLYLFTPHKFTSGIGSQLRIVANSMMQAIIAGRTFVLDDTIAHSPFIDPTRCSSRGYSCVFEPPSPCGVRDAGLGESEVAAMSELAKTEKERHGPGDQEAYKRATALLPREPLPAAVGPRVVVGRSTCFRFSPDNLTLPSAANANAVREAAVGPEWFVQQVMGYLTRPNARLAQLTEGLRRHLELPGDAEGGYAAVHMRFGDKKQEAKLHNISEYVKVLEQVTRSGGGGGGGGAAEGEEAAGGGGDQKGLLPTTVFLSTDTKSVYVELPKRMPQLRFVWVPQELFVPAGGGGAVASKIVDQIYSAEGGGNKHGAAGLARAGKLPAWLDGVAPDEGQLLMAQAQLLGEARSIVGTYTSNYGLLAHDLAAWVRIRQRRGRTPAFALL